MSSSSTDSEATPETTPAENSADSRSAEPKRPSRVVLWVLVVVGVAVALGALWFAVFGSPGVVGGRVVRGAKTSATPLQSAASGERLVPAQLTAADVRAVLSDIDYEHSQESTLGAYDDAVTRLMRGVDLLEFARTTLEATDAVMWTDVGAQHPRRVGGAEKEQLVAEALVHWTRIRAENGGDATPLASTLAESLYPPSVGDRNRPDSLFSVLAQGLRPLGLMFGAQGPGNRWSWRAETVSVTGTSTADVTYSAAAAPGAGWTFADPGARYTKRLRFSRSAEGRWRLAGWTNFSAVEQQFRGNVRPLGSVVRTEHWWGAL